MKRGPNAGSRLLLDQLVTSAGRHPGSDIFLDDVTVSRRHAEFRREDDEFKVVDVRSLNGIYVNREAVESAVLTSGDEIQIGWFRLVFSTERQNDSGDHAGDEAVVGGDDLECARAQRPLQLRVLHDRIAGLLGVRADKPSE